MSLVDLGLFALLFLILVFIHELGHFLMAKWVGIKVEKFSIGMGPKLFSFTKGETEYKLELLPLGGYVKMAGDDPTKEYSEEEKRRGFLSKKPPQKLLVVFGGPAFNLILPLFIFGLTLATGIPTMKAVVGSLEAEMPGALAGLQSGDRILTIDGRPAIKFQDIEVAVEKSSGSPLNLEIERVNLQTGAKEILTKTLQPKKVPGKTKFGEETEVFRIGVGPDFTSPEIFFDDPESLAARSGLKPFDKIKKINSVEILSADQLEKAWTFVEPGPLSLVVERDRKTVSVNVEIPNAKTSVPARLGLLSTQLVLGMVEKNSPAARAGLQIHDFLVSINGQELKDWDDVTKFVRGSDGKALQIKWNRKGKPMEASILPEKTVIEDPLMGKDNPLARDPVYRIGISPAKAVETALMFERSLNPIDWIKRGFSETWNMTKTTVIALSKLFTGQLSIKLLGSPIMIYKVAGNSYRMAGGGYLGWYSFLTTLAMLSITLGLVNLLPIPVLDGGHATFFIIEWIRRRPVSVRFMEIATQVGLFLLIALFGVVLFNDFTRYGFFDSIVKLFR
jgi:regulator of sigma E protease